MNDTAKPEEGVVKVVEADVPVMVPTTPMEMLAVATQNNAAIDVIGKYMDLQERWEKNEARKAYAKDMATAKKSIPTILKTEHVKYKKKDGTVTEYDHASAYNVVNGIALWLAPFGFTMDFNTPQTTDNKSIVVECIITHELGHSKKTALPGPPDTSGNKNSIQAVGSTTEYLKRYTALLLTGLSAKGQDDDGRTSEPVEKIDDEQYANIKAKVQEYEPWEAWVMDKYKIHSLDSLTVPQYEEAIKALNTAKR